MKTEKVLGFLKSFDKVIASWVQVICVILLASIVITITTSVFTRKVIFYPLNFADPLSKYLMMWMVFLGVGLAVRAGEHIAVDMLMNKLRDKAKKNMLMIINILVSLFLLAVIYYGFINAWNGKGSHDPFVFGISMMIPYLSVPVGALYVLIQLNVTTMIQVLSKDTDRELGG